MNIQGTFTQGSVLGSVLGPMVGSMVGSMLGLASGRLARVSGLSKRDWPEGPLSGKGLNARVYL
jgi:hypothetical protein